MFKTNFHTKFH